MEQRKAKSQLTPNDVPNKSGKGEINNFTKAWKAECNKAGMNRLFHYFRRTAIHNMVRAGIPERVTMQIIGPKRDQFLTVTILCQSVI